MNRILGILGGLVALSAIASNANAGYLMGIYHSGASSVSVLPGDSVQLQVVITADVAEAHNSAIFRVNFSAPGLLYTGYEWESPYLNGTLDDDSKPLGGTLPLLLDDLTLAGVGYPAGITDIEFSNVLPIGPNFGSGVIATLTLVVPDLYSGPPEIQISLAPDQISLNGNDISTRTGGVFTLIIPSPSVSSMVLVTVSGLLNRRRRR